MVSCTVVPGLSGKSFPTAAFRLAKLQGGQGSAPMKPSQRVVSSDFTFKGDDWKTTHGELFVPWFTENWEGRWRRTPLPLICMAHPSEDGSMPKAFGKAMRRSRNEWAQEIAAYYC